MCRSRIFALTEVMASPGAPSGFQPHGSAVSSAASIADCSASVNAMLSRSGVYGSAIVVDPDFAIGIRVGTAVSGDLHLVHELPHRSEEALLPFVEALIVQATDEFENLSLLDVPRLEERYGG